MREMPVLQECELNNQTELRILPTDDLEGFLGLGECIGKDNWPKPACSLVLSEAVSNHAVWPVISAITGPICALASNIITENDLSTRGHHDWPVMAIRHCAPG
jgi:hypothetical protein